MSALPGRPVPPLLPRRRGPKPRPDANYKHPLYEAWCAMKRRCYQPRHDRYARYGGRGISVCLRWRESFTDFVADVGVKPPGTLLDRIDNDGNYEPGNVRWATPLQQNRNRDQTQFIGERNAFSVLTDDCVYVIRRVAALGIFSRAQLGAWFGVNRSTIRNVLIRRNWRHVS